MKLEQKRIFISDLPDNITEGDVNAKFNHFGNVTSIEIKERKEVGPKNNSKHFAYINVDVDYESLQQCFEEFSKKKWKGSYVEIQLAKESFLDRLKRERAEAQNKNQPEAQNKNQPEAQNKNQLEVRKEHSKEEVKIQRKPVIRNGSNSKAQSSSEDSSSEEEEEKVEVKEIKILKPNIPKEDLNEIYSDIIVKNNKFKKVNNKIESLGFEPIIRYEPGKQKSKDPKRMEAEQKRINSMIEMKKGYRDQKNAIQAALSKIDARPKNKIIFGETDKVIHEKRNLFDEDDDEIGDETDKMFEHKKQFEGVKGQKLFELQSKYKNDERFQLDSRFASSENEETLNMGDEDDVEAEKRRELEILGEVLGKKILPKSVESQKRKTMTRFDPSQPDHSKYEVKETPISKKRRKEIIEEKKEELPEVSKEQFYKVADVFKSSFQEKESFSLLTMFGRKDVEEETFDEEEAVVIDKKKGNQFGKEQNPFRYDSSDDEERNEKEKKLVKNGGDGVEEKTKTVALGATRLWTEPFFFQKDDYRYQEGLDFIRRLEVEEKSEFHKLRRDLKEIVRAKVRNNQRNNRPFKKKLGNAGRKKMIRMKKALKR